MIPITQGQTVNSVNATAANTKPNFTIVALGQADQSIQSAVSQTQAQEALRSDFVTRHFRAHESSTPRTPWADVEQGSQLTSPLRRATASGRHQAPLSAASLVRRRVRPSTGNTPDPSTNEQSTSTQNPASHSHEQAGARPKTTRSNVQQSTRYSDTQEASQRGEQGQRRAKRATTTTVSRTGIKVGDIVMSDTFTYAQTTPTVCVEDILPTSSPPTTAPATAQPTTSAAPTYTNSLAFTDIFPAGRYRASAAVQTCEGLARNPAYVNETVALTAICNTLLRGASNYKSFSEGPPSFLGNRLHRIRNETIYTNCTLPFLFVDGIRVTGNISQALNQNYNITQEHVAVRNQTRRCSPVTGGFEYPIQLQDLDQSHFPNQYDCREDGSRWSRLEEYVEYMGDRAIGDMEKFHELIERAVRYQFTGHSQFTLFFLAAGTGFLVILFMGQLLLANQVAGFVKKTAKLEEREEANKAEAAEKEEEVVEEAEPESDPIDSKLTAALTALLAELEHVPYGPAFPPREVPERESKSTENDDAGSCSSSVASLNETQEEKEQRKEQEQRQIRVEILLAKISSLVKDNEMKAAQALLEDPEPEDVATQYSERDLMLPRFVPLTKNTDEETPNPEEPTNKEEKALADNQRNKSTQTNFPDEDPSQAETLFRITDPKADADKDPKDVFFSIASPAPEYERKPFIKSPPAFEAPTDSLWTPYPYPELPACLGSKRSAQVKTEREKSHSAQRDEKQEWDSNKAKIEEAHLNVRQRHERWTGLLAVLKTEALRRQEVDNIAQRELGGMNQQAQASKEGACAMEEGQASEEGPLSQEQEVIHAVDDYLVMIQGLDLKSDESYAKWDASNKKRESSVWKETTQKEKDRLAKAEMSTWFSNIISDDVDHKEKASRQENDEFMKRNKPEAYQRKADEAMADAMKALDIKRAQGDARSTKLTGDYLALIKAPATKDKATLQARINHADNAMKRELLDEDIIRTFAAYKAPEPERVDDAESIQGAAYNENTEHREARRKPNGKDLNFLVQEVVIKHLPDLMEHSTYKAMKHQAVVKKAVREVQKQPRKIFFNDALERHALSATSLNPEWLNVYPLMDEITEFLDQIIDPIMRKEQDFESKKTRMQVSLTQTLREVMEEDPSLLSSEELSEKLWTVMQENTKSKIAEEGMRQRSKAVRIKLKINEMAASFFAKALMQHVQISPPTAVLEAMSLEIGEIVTQAMTPRTVSKLKFSAHAEKMLKTQSTIKTLKLDKSALEKASKGKDPVPENPLETDSKAEGPAEIVLTDDMSKEQKILGLLARAKEKREQALTKEVEIKAAKKVLKATGVGVSGLSSFVDKARAARN